MNCTWPGTDELMLRYHNEEWGVPLYDDKKLFEFMVLDTFQAGLSWKTILHKRENFRKAFSNFNAVKIAQYSDKDVQRLMQDTGIIRNFLKIKGTINNAQQFIRLQKEHKTFSDYIWQFTDGKIIDHRLTVPSAMPVNSAESDAMSKALKKEGFKFAGSVICYAFMQAAGMINDHFINCTARK